MSRSKTFVVLIAMALGLLALGGWLILRASPEDLPPIVATTTSPQPSPSQGEGGEETTPTPYEGEGEGGEVEDSGVILLNAPFVVQAPLGDWENVVFQQGCEEASILMAMLWVQDKKFITPKDAEKAIIAISNFEQKKYGEFRDTSAADTARWARDYFDYESIEVKYDINAKDIKIELVKGNLVIVPVNGQKLGNPFYTPPGPIQHMLVIRGYDAERKEFITNDPGTKHGEGFRYPASTLEQALQDYGTGYKEPIGELRKAMIVVTPMRPVDNF